MPRRTKRPSIVTCSTWHQEQPPSWLRTVRRIENPDCAACQFRRITFPRTMTRLAFLNSTRFLTCQRLFRHARGFSMVFP